MATPSIDAPVSPLRQRMQHDMLMRGLGSHTRQDYVRQVRCFAAFLGRSPDTATPDDIRCFQLDQHEKGVGPANINGAVSALRFLLPVPVLGKLFRRLFLTRLIALHDAGRLGFFGSLVHLADRRAFVHHLAPVRKKRWVVYAKAPFAGPEAVPAYLSRYTHRVAISNSRLIAFDETGVTFRYKDYRRDGANRQQVMTLAANEFIRRFLIHVLPRGFHRIRHYGLLAGPTRKASLALARELLEVARPPDPRDSDEPDDYRPPCPCCGGRMIIIETFERWRQPRGPPHASATNRENAP